MRSFEVLCIDGGSKDRTLDIIKEYQKKDKRVRLLANPKRLPEGKGNGKWLGFRKAMGEIVGIIDHDNVLQDNSLFENVAAIFEKEKDALGILAGLKHDIHDPAIVRFVALYGGDPFFAYRSVDFLRHFQKQDSSLPYEQIVLQENNLFLTGGNCFFYQKKDVKSVGGYDQDVLIVQRLVCSGKTKLLIIPEATKHYAEKSLIHLAKKMLFQKRAYYSRNQERFNYLPQTVKEFNSFIKIISFNLLLLPNIVPATYLFIKFKDPIALTFIPLVFLNTVSHAINFLCSGFVRNIRR
jgi:glycosyltransferase involved in cell wall biosynthesis